MITLKIHSRRGCKDVLECRHLMTLDYKDSRCSAFTLLTQMSKEPACEVTLFVRHTDKVRLWTSVTKLHCLKGVIFEEDRTDYSIMEW